MKDIFKFLFVVAWLTAVCTMTAAREYFRVIDSRMGLPDNTVTDIVQDARGYIWLGTSNGMCRYDGVTFTTFRHNPDDDTSLSSSFVNALAVDKAGIFAGTNSCLDLYSFSTGKFVHCFYEEGARRSRISQSIQSVVSVAGRTFYADASGGLYANRSGDICTFRRVARNFRAYSLCRYEGDMLLAACADGIRMLTSGGSVVAFCPYKSGGPLEKLNISYIPYNHTAYVGSGLGFASAAFTVSRNSITRSTVYSPKDLTCAIPFKGGTLFGTDGHGVELWRNGRVNVYNTTTSVMSGNVVYSLFVDRVGDFWVGTYRSGLNHYTGESSLFTLFNKDNGKLSFNIVTSIVPADEKIYIGLDGGGLDIYNRKTHSLTRLSTDNSGIAGDNVVSMVKDADNLWLAVYTKGLVQYSLSSGKFTSWPMPGVGGDKDNVWCLYDDGAGNVWVAGPRLYVFNKSKRKYIRVSGLPDAKFSAITGHGHYVWVSSNIYGIYKIDKRTMKVAERYSHHGKGRFSLPVDNIKYVYVDKKGSRMWFTAENIGFYSMDLKTGELVKYGTEDGLTYSSVTSIVEDGRGYMWIGTNGGGLFCHDPKSGTFVRYDEMSDIPTTFTYSAATIYDGNVYFGTINGMLFFSPAKVQQSKMFFNVDFMELGPLVGGHEKINLYCSDNNIKLRYNENFFTVRFAVPELRIPESVRFSCRLEGLETDWRDLGSSREVSYTNVPPGKYKLYVRCIDATGKWGKPSVLDITVTPPWWRTLWAMILWLVLIVAVVAGVVYFYIKTQNIKQRMRISEIEKDATKKLSESKLNFYTNVTHELRTPVFLIMGQLEELMSKGKSVAGVPLSYLQMMYRSASKLNRIVTSVLDIRKMDSGKLKLQLEKDDVIKFCREHIDDYTALCEYKDITFTFVHHKASIMARFDKEKLDIIMSNLITNAYKYTKEGGRVTLTVSDSPQDVIITVKDNGIGILKEMQTAVFEDFFRTERGQKQSAGDGVGLSFVKQLVELHGGVIRVESEPEHGAAFTFNIPKRLDEYTDEAKVSVKAVKVDVAEPEQIKEPVVEKDSGSVKVEIPKNPTALHSILIIDDERETVNLLERSLSADFKIYKAYDGETGLDIARKMLPDIVLCDLMLPNMDGMEILKTLKNDKKLQLIKIVIFTAKTSEEAMIEAFDNGVDAYVTKPISLKYLRMRIDRLVAQSDAADVTGQLAVDKKSYNKEEQIFLLRCREIIDDNLTNEDFSVDFLADKLAMSHSSLYKKIKAMTGMSLIEFINEYKIYKAVQMFKEGAVNVDKVSYRCGFNDVKNFREMFKRKMKMTPKQYVQSLS